MTELIKLYFLDIFDDGVIAACHTVVARYVVLEKILTAKSYVPVLGF